MNTTFGFMITRMLLDCVGIILIAFIVYIIVYYIRKYMLIKWISKAVNAAEIMFSAPENTKENSLQKKDWVLKFLNDNGLTSGVSDDVVDTLIEAEVNALNIQKGAMKK